MTTTVKCGACGRGFASILKLHAHIGKAHKGQTVEAAILEKTK